MPNDNEIFDVMLIANKKCANEIYFEMPDYCKNFCNRKNTEDNKGVTSAQLPKFEDILKEKYKDIYLTINSRERELLNSLKWYAEEKCKISPCQKTCQPSDRFFGMEKGKTCICKK